MGDAELVYAVVDAAADEARRALSNYFRELDERFAGGFGAAEPAVDEAARLFNPPAGLFVVARLGDEVVGCGAVQWLDDRTAELRRMWVDPDRRGIGLGKGLLVYLEEVARGEGRSRVVLDTNASLSEAIAMYRACGYMAIDRYNDNPYAHHWFEKVLPHRRPAPPHPRQHGVE